MASTKPAELLPQLATPRIKICGLTRGEDALLAAQLGAQYLGFVVHPSSPRHITLTHARALLENVKEELKNIKAAAPTPVCVCVNPEAAFLTEALSGGYFGAVQIHFKAEAVQMAELETWAHITRGENVQLWLAPKFAEGSTPTPANCAQYIHRGAKLLLDAPTPPGVYGGTGNIANWAQFKALANAYGAEQCILAGGLHAANVAEAIAQTGAALIDGASGTEASPGIKCPKKLTAFINAANAAWAARAANRETK